MNLERAIAVLLTTVGLLAPSTSFAVEVPHGPPIGTNRYETTIEPAFQGDVDVDQYAAILVAGERLDVTVTAGRGSDLRPALELLDPDGAAVPLTVTLAKKGKVARIRRFDVPRSGRWTVRVDGGETTGSYRVEFRVKAPRPVTHAGVLLPEAPGDVAVHPVDAASGSHVELKLSLRGKAGTVAITGITDPSAAAVPGAAAALAGAVARRRKPAKVRDLELSSGAGAYAITLAGADVPEAGLAYKLRVRVTPAERPKARKPVPLDPREPRFDAVAPLTEGIAGAPITFTGLQFDPSPLTRVFVGPSQAQVTELTDDSLRLVPPGGPEGIALPIRLVHPDGQFALLSPGFLYAPGVEPESLVDGSGKAVSGGPIGGDHQVTIRGTDLSRTASVLFGGRAALIIGQPQDGEVAVTTPSGAADDTVGVTLRDRFGRLVTAPFHYEYKRAPLIDAADPYEIQVNVALGTSVLSVRGAGFEPADVVVLDGELLTSRLQHATRLVAVAPVLQPGDYAVSVTDRLGLTVVGPTLTVALPPTISELYDAEGRRVRQGETAGGRELLLEGARFDENSRVRFGENEATIVELQSATRLLIRVPAAATAGSVDVVVTDDKGNAGPAPFEFEYFVIPTLPAGNGFSGTTAVPAKVGSGAASDAEPMARWDVVPHQTFDREFEIGVVAFHVNGIDRVEFSAEGGTWTAVDAPRRNPRTGVWEYVARLDPADFGDGQVEVRAVVYPQAGVPRVLGGPLTSENLLLGEHSMMLNADAGHSLPQPVRWVDVVAGSDATGDGSSASPFASPYRALQDIQSEAESSSADACDGALIYCRPGNYSWGPAPYPYPLTSKRWATILPSPDAGSGEVIFDAVDSGGMRTALICARGVRLDGYARFNTVSGSGSLWIDQCTLTGPDRGADLGPFTASHWDGVYMTDTSLRTYRNGAVGARLVRNVAISDLGSDAFSNSSLVIDSTVQVIDPSGTANHPDVYQFSGSGTRENVIVYGIEVRSAAAQGIFVDDLAGVKDIAFVNVLIVRPLGSLPADPPFSQWIVPSEHVLLAGVALPNQSFHWREPSMTDVAVRGCLFARMVEGSGPNGAAQVPDSWFEHNHFIDLTLGSSVLRGTDATTGDPGFADPTTGDFRPATNSVLRNRLTDPVAPVDLSGEPRLTPDVVGPLR